MFNVEKYIEDVQKQIEYFKEYTDLFDEHLNEIDPAILQKAIARYSSVNFHLLSEYQRSRGIHEDLKADFQEWSDPKYLEIKEELSKGRPASYKLTGDEIQISLRVKYKDEYRQWIDKINEKKLFMDFMEKLLKQWSEHGYILNVADRNMRAEMANIKGNDREANREEDQPIRRRVIQ